MISSSQNTKIKLVRSLQSHRKQRTAEAAFVAEGVRLVEEAVITQSPLVFILYDETLSERGVKLVEQLKAQGNSEIYQVTPAVMAEVSDTESPQGILAVVKGRALPLPTSPTFIVLADQIRDPGNLGTLLRTAEAVGTDVVLVTPGTVDAFSPKVVRAGMGAHFHLPIHALPWEEIYPYLKGLPVFLSVALGGTPIWDANFRQPCVLLIGGEAVGASHLGETFATHRVTIPMAGHAESLNAAVAAGILMAEVLRQRYSRPKGP